MRFDRTVQKVRLNKQKQKMKRYIMLQKRELSTLLMKIQSESPSQSADGSESHWITNSEWSTFFTARSLCMIHMMINESDECKSA